jgi:hypothetical protein
LIVCNLTKPESTFDQVRKAYPDLLPTDAALLATAIVEAGRWSIAEYDGHVYEWSPEAQGPMSQAVLAEVRQIQESLEGTGKKTAKAVKLEGEEQVTLTIPIRASQKVGEQFLGSRNDLKTMLSDILQEGVEFHYSTTDLVWQWAMERVNWTTVADGEASRRIKFSADFVDNNLAVELGPGGKKKAVRKKA